MQLHIYITLIMNGCCILDTAGLVDLSFISRRLYTIVCKYTKNNIIKNKVYIYLSKNVTIDGSWSHLKQ